MAEGPELGADPPPPPKPPPPSDAARIIDATAAARNAILRAIAVATLLILLALAYQRCTDPYFRCKRLWENSKSKVGSVTLSEHELETWNELECSEWPGIG